MTADMTWMPSGSTAAVITRFIDRHAVTARNAAVDLRPGLRVVDGDEAAAGPSPREVRAQRAYVHKLAAPIRGGRQRRYPGVALGVTAVVVLGMTAQAVAMAVTVELAVLRVGLAAVYTTIAAGISAAAITPNVIRPRSRVAEHEDPVLRYLAAQIRDDQYGLRWLRCCRAIAMPSVVAVTWIASFPTASMTLSAGLVFGVGTTACRALVARREINTLAMKGRWAAVNSDDELPSDLGLARRAIAEAAEREQVSARFNRDVGAERRAAR